MSLLYQSRSELDNIEIARLSGIIKKTVRQFTGSLQFQFKKDEEIDTEDFLDRLEKEDDLLEALQGVSDHENTDSETDSKEPGEYADKEKEN